MTTSRAMAALVDGLVDYAGLFPPAALTMPDAVAAYARHRAGPDAPMLGRFVLPAGRLDEFALAVSSAGAGSGAHAGGESPMPWRLSVLAGATDAEVLAGFNARHGARTVVDTVESKAESVESIAALRGALGARYSVYVELPVLGSPAERISALVGAIAMHGMRAKIRTGGVTTDAFPSSRDVVHFLRACHAAGVPFKATAGLHHPLRGDFPLTYAPDSDRGTMFGFLNVFLAAVFLHAGADDRTLVALMEERDQRALLVSDGAIRWRTYTVTTAQIAAARAAFAGSFGSCSFDEPARELPLLTSAPR